jgi:hypothetical protein
LKKLFSGKKTFSEFLKIHFLIGLRGRTTRILIIKVFSKMTVFLLQMALSIFNPVVTIFRTTLALIMKGPTTGSFSYDQYIRQALYSAKVLQTLMVNGLRDHSRFQPFEDYWTFVGKENVIVSLYSVAAALEKVEEFQSEAGLPVVASVRKIALRLQRTVCCPFCRCFSSQVQIAVCS